MESGMFYVNVKTDGKKRFCHKIWYHADGIGVS
jgi:hypothetical protein